MYVPRVCFENGDENGVKEEREREREREIKVLCG